IRGRNAGLMMVSYEPPRHLQLKDEDIYVRPTRMKPANVYHKTEKGVDEIARRTFRLPQRLRTILIMVDGIKPAALLLQHAGQLGMNGESLLELEQSGFITLNPAAEPDVAKAAAMPSAAEVDQFLRAQEAMNQLILDKIGSIRGYGLMLKL